MIEFIADEKYRLRLLPNINDFSSNVKSLKIISNNKQSINVHFAYVFDENNQKSDCIKLGNQFKIFVQNCITGFYGTSDGYFISDFNEIMDNNEFYVPKYYYSNENKSKIYTENSLKRFVEKSKQNLFEKHTDVIPYKRINLFDIKSEFILNVDVYDVEIVEFKNLKKFVYSIEKYKPLWSDGDCKDDILKLYTGLKQLDNVIDEYKKYIEFTSPKANFIFE